ncbi:MAG TPA: hypothetical protein VIY53_17000 [Acidobacteriaceae bacterium]
MPILFRMAFAFAILPVCLPAPSNAQSQNAGTNSVVIVFKDGHRQTVNLADLDRIEFPGPVPAGLLSVPGPSRTRFIGRWEVGEGNGENFVITLYDDGTAFRSLRETRGTWQYVNGEAQIRWDDGSDDCIRKVGSWYKKYWYKPEEAFAGTPENVTNARNLSGNPRGVD